MFDRYLEMLFGTNDVKGRNIMLNGTKLAAHVGLNTAKLSGKAKTKIVEIFKDPYKVEIPKESIDEFSKLAKENNIDFVTAIDKRKPNSTIVAFSENKVKEVQGVLETLVKNKTINNENLVNSELSNSKNDIPKVSIEKDNTKQSESDIVIRRVNKRLRDIKREYEFIKTQNLLDNAKSMNKTVSKETSR